MEIKIKKKKVNITGIELYLTSGKLNMSEKLEPELHIKLKKTWDDTPLSKRISKENFQLISQENRYLILRALNSGIPEQEHNYIRHILTAQEILDYIQKNHNDEFKLTNVYFHLQKLQEKGLITEVTQIGTGKRPKSFYGRTAKIYLNTDNLSADLENDDFYLKFFQIIKFIRPNLSFDEIKSPFKELNSLIYEKEQAIIEEWFRTHKDIIDKVEIDPYRLYMYLAKLLDFHNDFIKFNHQIADILNLEMK